MPKLLMGEELEKEMFFLPDYDAGIRDADAAARLMALNSISDIYLPNAMSYEIYSKVYLAMLHSLGKKQTIDAVRQGNQNHRRIQELPYNSILGGSDSFSIVGPSGIGKSTALNKGIALAGGNDVITTDAPFAEIIGCINVQCPHDCSVKGLLLAVLSQLDATLGTKYAELAVKNRYTIDILIGTVSQVALNNILLIVIDECQNISYNMQKTKSWNGRKLISALTQLINSSGVSICLVGLPEMEDIFSSEMQLARRSIGLSYSALPYEDYFVRLCEVLFRYQYVSSPSELTPEILEVLYECSGGIIAIVVSLIVEAQQIAILTGKERLDKETIRMAFDSRMKSVQDFVAVSRKNRGQTSSVRKRTGTGTMEKEDASESRIGIVQISSNAKKCSKDIVRLLMDSGIRVREVAG